MKKLLFSFLSFFYIGVLFAQDAVKIPIGSTPVMYVEYGGKGIKLGIIAFTDKKYRKYVPIENKELNLGLSKNIEKTGEIDKRDIDAAVTSSNDAYQQLLNKYKDQGLTDNNVYFYTSSGVGVASNVQKLCEAVQAKTNHGVYVVKEAEEAKYTIAGTIPYDKIDVALVLDQGGSNTKGGYVINDGVLVAVPVVFDLGSVRVAETIEGKYMTDHPDDAEEYKNLFISGMNKCFDSLRKEIRNSFSNIQGAEDRNELYLSGGAAFVISTINYPEYDATAQLVPLNFERLKSFLLEIQDRSNYKSLKDKTFTNEKVSKTYASAFKIYNQLQLISASKLLLTYINALGGDNKKIYFNRFGLHAMPSMLIGRVLRGDTKRW